MDELPSLRTSTKERDAAVNRLQTAFLEGRLTDSELGDRIDRALSARLAGELTAVLADLPVPVATPGPPGAIPGATALKWALVHKGSAVQGGLWTVPPRFKSLAYKGNQTLDLTRASLTAPVTEMRITAYKSTVEVVVPPGLRVEVRGWGYAGGCTDETGGGPAEGPVLVVKALVYKGRVVVRRG